MAAITFPLDDSTPLRFLLSNPKLKGSNAAERYERYKTMSTAGAVRSVVGSVAGNTDMKNDHTKGYLEVWSGGSWISAVGGVTQGVGAVTGKRRAGEGTPQKVRERKKAKDGEEGSDAELEAVKQKLSPSKSALLDEHAVRSSAGFFQCRHEENGD